MRFHSHFISTDFTFALPWVVYLYYKYTNIEDNNAVQYILRQGWPLESSKRIVRTFQSQGTTFHPLPYQSQCFYGEESHKSLYKIATNKYCSKIDPKLNEPKPFLYKSRVAANHLVKKRKSHIIIRFFFLFFLFLLLNCFYSSWCRLCFSSRCSLHHKLRRVLATQMDN